MSGAEARETGEVDPGGASSAVTTVAKHVNKAALRSFVLSFFACLVGTHPLLPFSSCLLAFSRSSSIALYSPLIPLPPLSIPTPPNGYRCNFAP